MDYRKYKTDGWGLSELALKTLNKIISELDKEVIRVVEFGSGKSTEFLHDLNKEIDATIEVTSFDNDPTYAYKPKTDDNVTINMRELVECTDDDYERMFRDRTYHQNVMKPKTSELNTRQKNNFYNIKEDDINGIYDIVVLDGPNGNGRNIAFLHILDHVNNESYILIDDTSHYDFIDKFNQLFDAEVYYEIKKGEYQDNFSILKIK